jgi:DNA repair photolyase
VRWRLDGEGPQGALFDDEQLVERHVGSGLLAGTELLHVQARTILNRVPPGARMPFAWTINAYRGCGHACTYCYARPTHEFLGLGIGEDFERKLVVKVNAVERVRAELAAPSWRGEHVAIGTNTDPYQRAEGKYHLYRGILTALAERANPFSVLTKSTLVLRDLDVLRAAKAVTDVRVNLSIGTLDDDVWRATEPGAPHPRRRVEAVRRLAEAGIPCGVLMGPIIPGLSDGDDQLAEVVDAVVAAGAESVSAVALHLRPGVKDVFLSHLEQTHPDLAPVLAARYARSSTLPKAEQQALSQRVRRLVDGARRRHGNGGRAVRTRAIDTADGDLRRIVEEQGMAPRAAVRSADPAPGGPVTQPVQATLF